jgi:predicted neuraminidase
MNKLLTSIILLLTSILPAGANPFHTSEPIFPPQEKHVHSSSIVACPNGDFLVCWFHGSGERKADDVKIQGARLARNSKNWSPVFIMADTPGLPDCNPVLFVDAKERLWLFWVVVQANRWELSILKYRLSGNYQKTTAPVWDWQDIILFQPGEAFAQAIKTGFDALVQGEPMWAEYAPPYHEMIIEAAKDPRKQQTGWMTRIHPLVLASGRILLPLYSDGFNVSLVAISDDIGQSWRASWPMVGFGPIQPTLVSKQNGELVAYSRDSGDAPYRVLKSSSTDAGETWSPTVDTEIPNPGSSLEVIVLNNGYWLMVLNDTEDGRQRLAVWLSDDEGASWKWKRYVGISEKNQKYFAYPSIIQSKDGLIHLTYTYNENNLKTIHHDVFNLEWLTGK